MPAESIYVAQLMLTFQAVGVGEAHDNGDARRKVIEWIEKDWVNDLVVELPSFAGAQGAAILDRLWTNPVTLTQLLQTAAANNVNVHAWDDFHQVGVEQGSAAGMAGRNRAVAAAFAQQFGAVTNAHHCVILFGANHFTGDNGFEALLPGLKWADLSR